MCWVHQSQALFMHYVMTCVDVLRTATLRRVVWIPDGGPGVRQTVRHQLPAEAHASPRRPAAALVVSCEKAGNPGEADQHSPPPKQPLSAV